MNKRAFLIPCLIAAAVATELGLQINKAAQAVTLTDAGIVVAQADVSITEEADVDVVITDETESNSDWLFDYYFEDVSLTDSQRSEVNAAFTRYDNALSSLEGEDYVITDEEASAALESSVLEIENNLLEDIEAELTPEQMVQVRQNISEAEAEVENWEPTPEEVAAWEADIRQQSFDQWFGGIEMTPEQEAFIKAEIDRSADANNRVIAEAEADGSDLMEMSDAEYAVLEEEFKAIEEEFDERIAARLSAEQMQQYQENQNRLLEEIEAELDEN